MPAPEIWGPAVWKLFHTLIEQLNEEAFAVIGPQLYLQFVRICKFLPCPECAADATNFLAKINFQTNIKSKVEFRNTFYLFHNWVNAKKRKQLFNYGNILIYGKYNLIGVVNNFLSAYHTKGNMKMLAESFQRNMVVNSFKGWFTSVISAFTPAPKVEQPIAEVKDADVSVEVAPVEEEVKVDEVAPVVEEVKVEEVTPVEEVAVVEEVVNVKETAVEEEVVNVKETAVEEEVAPVEEEVKIKEAVVAVKVAPEKVEEKEAAAIDVEEKPKAKKGKKGKK